MASKDPDDPPNTETDEETLALRKKRSRRVSFADREITSIHIFNRDEDYETPPESRPSSDDLGQGNEVLRFLKDFGDSDDSKDLSPGGEDDDLLDARKSFLRPIESPSPGSSTIASAASNDEDNYFGPVSASFIRPGKLSDSEASDDNHDITMDSTAFSLHFRSLVRSEAGGDLKTPTGVRLAFEEKTPTQNTIPSDPGSFMELTKAKKQNMQTSILVDKVSGGRDSNDMSLVGESLQKYDYGRLSPTLDALLAESSKDLHSVSVAYPINSKPFGESEVSALDENVNDLMDPNAIGDREMINIGTYGTPRETVSVKANGMSLEPASTTTAIDQITLDNTNDGSGVDTSSEHQIQTPNRLTKGSDEFTDDANATSRSRLRYPAVISGPPQTTDGNIHQLNVFPRHESGDQHLKDQGKESSLKDRKIYSSIDQKSDQQYGSLLSGSKSSLSAKRYQFFFDTANSSRHPLNVTPSPKPLDSFLSKETTKHGESLSSIRNSISKLHIFGASPNASTLKEGIERCASTLKDGIEKSRLQLFDYPTRTSPTNSALVDGKASQNNHVNYPIARLEDHFSVDLKNGEHNRKTDIDSDVPKSLKYIKQGNNLSEKEETTDLVEDREYQHYMSIDTLSKDKPTKLITAAASPSQYKESGKNVMNHLLMRENPPEGTLIASGTDTPLVNIAFDDRRDVKATGIPDKLFSSPVNSLDEKLLASTEYQGILSGELKQLDKYNKLVSISTKQDGNSVENMGSGSYSTATVDKLDRIVQSSSPLINVNNRVEDRQIDLPGLQNEPDTFRNFGTPSRDTDSMKFQLGSPDRSSQTETDPSGFKKEIPLERIKASCGSASTDVHRSSNGPFLEKTPSRKELAQSPTRQGSTQRSSIASQDNSVQHSVGKSFGFPKVNSDGHCNNDCNRELHTSQSLFPTWDIENSSGQKRSGEIALGDGNYRIQRSPKVHKTGGHDSDFLLEHPNGNNDIREKIRDETKLKHWTNILLGFSGDTKELLSPLIDKLNIRAISVLEDILVHLQKAKSYEMLSSEIQSQSQKISDQLSNIRHNRVAGIRMLLCKLMYDKAKLQLMCVRRGKLLNRVKLLGFGIQESQNLKLNYIQHLTVAGTRDTQVDTSLHSCLVNFGSKNEVPCDKVIAMRQEFEVLDKKIKNLIKSFHTYCKLKGEPSSADTIVLVNDHLKKRARCRLIRQELQLWEVVDLEKWNGHHNIVLNYQAFLCQRLTINTGSGLTISNKLNEITIVKNFPNMDACTAFAFVLKAEATKKYVALRSLAQETQITSSLLRNLLDVLEEVQLARVDIRNLIQIGFHCRSVEQLDLQLCFIDFNSGRKVTMTMDMTCLNHGVYPSEVVPYWSEAPTVGTQKSLPQSISAEIRAAVESVGVGYSRIIRLCKRISQVLQASSR